MSHVLSKQQVNISNTTPKYQKGKNVTLWILQAIIALTFLFVGGMKLILPVEALLAEMPIKMPDLFVRFKRVLSLKSEHEPNNVGIYTSQKMRL